MENELDQQPLNTATDAAQAPTATAPEPPAFDPASLEAEIKSFAPDWTLQDLPSRLRKLHQSNSELGRKYKEAETKANRFAPLEREMENPAFNTFMQEKLQEYYAAQAQQYGGYGTPQPLMQAFDPVMQQVQQQNIELRSLKIERDLDRLESSGFDIKDEARREALASKMIGSPDLTARDAYMILFAEDDMRNRERQAVTNTAQTIQKNNNAYKQIGTRTAAPQPTKFDAKTATKEQMIARTEEILAAMRGS